MESTLGNAGKGSYCVFSSAADIEGSIQGAIQYAAQPNIFVDRRAHQRVAFPQLFQVTPVDNSEKMQVCGDSVYVVGKNLSPTGIGFYHQVAIPSRYVVISLQHSPQEWHNFLVKVSWCRFLRPGWYDSGGQIIRMVEWQINDE
jgi:hypothetical protein